MDQFVLILLAAALALVLHSLILYARYRPQRRLDLATQRKSGSFLRFFHFLNSQYWSRRERLGFFTIVFVGWFTLGLAQQYADAILNMASMPVSIGGGSYAGPVNIAALKSHFYASSEQDLMLAIAYQQDGQRDQAQRLYRNLPQFAESWNNLGVILKNTGKDQEARAAFEKALQLDPKLAEAALNLGRPPSDFWTEQHQIYLPGRPMLTPPRGEQVDRALLGGSPVRLCLRALGGPFSGIFVVSFFSILAKLAA